MPATPRWRKDYRERRIAVNPDHFKDRNLRLRYGLTRSEYDKMLSAQGGTCAICGGPSTLPSGRFDVDHDHETGRVRGLLCRLCNTAIGKLKTPRMLRLAAEYLERK